MTKEELKAFKIDLDEYLKENYKGKEKMLEFKKLNVNPKGHKTGDCSTRAIVSTLGISYQEALIEQCEMAIKYCYGLCCKETTTKVLEKYGWVKMKQPRKENGKKYLVGEIDLIVTKKQLEAGVLISLAHHDTCAKGNYIIDTWDCRRKTIGNYWVKE